MEYMAEQRIAAKGLFILKVAVREATIFNSPPIDVNCKNKAKNQNNCYDNRHKI